MKVILLLAFGFVSINAQGIYGGWGGQGGLGGIGYGGLGAWGGQGLAGIGAWGGQGGYAGGVGIGGGYGGYKHAPAPIGHDGRVVDTPEVAHAKAEHFKALAAASHGKIGGAGIGLYAGAEQGIQGGYAGGYGGGYDGQKWHGPIAHIELTHDGKFVKDTPEVAHAKAQHLAAVAAAKHGGAGGYGGYGAGIGIGGGLGYGGGLGGYGGGAENYDDGQYRGEGEELGQYKGEGEYYGGHGQY